MELPPIVIVILFLTLPAGIIYLCQRFSWMNKIGSIIWAYAIGILFRLLGLIPEIQMDGMSMLPGDTIPQAIKDLTDISILIALPMLLFSLDFRKWLRQAKKTLLSMILAFVSIISMIVLGYFIFSGGLDDAWKISGLLTGVYTGGTPNMAAIKTALEVDQNIYIMTHTYDMVISLVWFIFIITIGQRVLNLILPKSKSLVKSDDSDDISMAEFDSYDGIFKKKTFFPVLAALGIAIIIFATGYALMSLMPENSKTVVIILYITTAGIILSFIPKVNKIDKSFQVGMYFIIVFSMAVASQADLKNLVNISTDLFLFVVLAVWGSLVVHILLSMIFKVDTDTVIITSSALAFSPPFVPVVAGALKNKDVLIPGLTVGIIGYAVGNYLGISLAYLLHGL
jgi:uncharacterized membrane protein